MKQNHTFFKNVCSLAIPVALQSMLQASFGMVDQIMIGQLGSVNVAGVGLAGKFSSIYTVVVSAIGAVAGIMIAQYLGQKNKPEVRRSFWINLALGCVLAGLFTLLCVFSPSPSCICIWKMKRRQPPLPVILESPLRRFSPLQQPLCFPHCCAV